MLIYEKKITVEHPETGEDVEVTTLFGTMGNVPGDNDEELTIKIEDYDEEMPLSILILETAVMREDLKSVGLPQSLLYFFTSSFDDTQLVGIKYLGDPSEGTIPFSEDNFKVYLGDICIIGEPKTPQEKEVVSIEIIEEPDITTYQRQPEGDEPKFLDMTGLTLNVEYSDGTTEEIEHTKGIEDGMIFDPQEGINVVETYPDDYDFNVTITFGGKQATQVIYINNPM